MRGMLSKGFFKCSALSSPPDGCARKREQAYPLPQGKRYRVLGPGLCGGRKDDSSEEGAAEQCVPIQQSAGVSHESLTESQLDISSEGEEEPRLYPSVVYEGEIATVKLGVGQIVVLEGCAMVQLVEGQAGMLGYSFPRGTDILVCSSSKHTEVVTIESRRGGAANQLGDAVMTDVVLQGTLGCQLRFASHTLGAQLSAGSGRSLSFRLDFVPPLGFSLEKDMGGEFLEQQNQEQDCSDSSDPCSDDDPLKLDLEADQLEVSVELAATEDSVKKRKGCGDNTDRAKRRRVVAKLDSFSSATSVPHDWKQAVGSGVPVVAVAVQRMLESLRLLGS